jgi:glucose/arabinose dehydrogenase
MTLTAGRRALLRTGIAAALACAVLAASAQPAPAAKLSQIGSFDEPVYVDNAPGKANRKLLFVVQKQGQVVVLRKGRPLARPFLDVSDITLGPAGSEQGLLSIAFHPNYERNRLFYVYLTQKDGDNAVYEFKRSKKSRTRAVRRSGRLVLEIPHPDDATNHNGGQLQFGPDKMLYLAPGDGGNTPEAAQDIHSLRGKILRIDPLKHGKRAYSIPKSNPLRGRDGRDEIFGLGLRNPFRFSFDSKTGALTIGDVGAGAREEVDYRVRKAAAGTNFGWPRFEGTALMDSSVQAPGAVPPIFDYDHSGGGCVVTGGYVIRDHRFRNLIGRYVYADFCIGEIRTLQPLAGGATGDAPLGVPIVPSLASFGEGRKGEIYAVSLDGPVYRLDP